MLDWKLSFRYLKCGYRHLSPFRSLISKKFYLIHWIRPQDPCLYRQAPYLSATALFACPISNIQYRIKFYSNIRYNVGLCSLQSDIGSSNIKLSPISLITDIGVSAHQWKHSSYFFTLVPVYRKHAEWKQTFLWRWQEGSHRAVEGWRAHPPPTWSIWRRRSWCCGSSGWRSPPTSRSWWSLFPPRLQEVIEYKLKKTNKLN